MKREYVVEKVELLLIRSQWALFCLWLLGEVQVIDVKKYLIKNVFVEYFLTSANITYEFVS